MTVLLQKSLISLISIINNLFKKERPVNINVTLCDLYIRGMLKRPPQSFSFV